MQCQFCKAEIPEGVGQCPQCGTELKQARPAAPQGANLQADDFGKLFSDATTIWKDNLGDLILLSLVLMLVGWIPIANVGFFAGYYRSILKVKRGEGKASPGDLFNAWDCFGSLLFLFFLAFVAMIILSIIPIIGSLAGLALSVMLAPAMYAVIDRKMGAIDSIRWGIETIKKDAINWLLAGVVGAIIGGIGAIALLVGIIVTLPWGALITASQYDRHRND